MEKKLEDRKNQEDWKNQIFTQKKLRDIYYISRKNFPQSKENKIIIISFLLFFIVIFSLPFFFNVCNSGNVFKISHYVSFLRWASNQSTAFSTSVLGFLVAGFAIFASITKVSVFIALAKTTYEKCDINQLQYIFFNFINSFIVYMIFLTVSLIIGFLFSESGPVLIYYRHYFSAYTKFNLVIGGVFSVIICQITVYSILTLKSFIWNLYQSVLLSIAINDEIDQKLTNNSSPLPPNPEQ